jgi:hypothetical protein
MFVNGSGQNKQSLETFYLSKEYTGNSCFWLANFYTPVFRRDVLWYTTVRPSVLYVTLLT